MTLTLTLTFGGVLSAQITASPELAASGSALPSAPSAQQRSTPQHVDGQHGSDVHFNNFKIVPEPGPIKPAIDRSFILMQGAAVGATVADAATTLYCIHHSTGREANPIFGTRPSPARIYGTILPLTAFLTYLDYHEKKDAPHSHWKVMPAIAAIAHTAATINNSRMILHTKSSQPSQK